MLRSERKRYSLESIVGLLLSISFVGPSGGSSQILAIRDELRDALNRGLKIESIQERARRGDPSETPILAKFCRDHEIAKTIVPARSVMAAKG